MESKKIYTLEVDPLAVGLTRPAMFMGVNLRLFFMNLMGWFLFCIDAHTLYGILFFIISHFFMVRASVKEPNFFWIWIKAFTKTPPSINSFVLWGRTNSYEPW